jgi:hypothetical protein
MGENSCGVPARAGQFGPLDEARVQIAAKDREIAELRKELDAATAALKASALDACDRILLRADRDEAREVAKRLWRALGAVRGADMYTCMVKRDGHDDQIEAVSAALEALDATPEHLR